MKDVEEDLTSKYENYSQEQLKEAGFTLVRRLSSVNCISSALEGFYKPGLVQIRRRSDVSNHYEVFVANDLIDWKYFRETGDYRPKRSFLEISKEYSSYTPRVLI